MFNEIKIRLFRNEEGNYYEDESECLKAMMSSMTESGHAGGTKDYCQACDSACQSCPRQGQWIKFNRDVLDKDCYCVLRNCSIQDQGWEWMKVDTEKCSKNAIKDGLGNCIGLQIERSSKSKETNEIEESAARRSGSSRIVLYPIILLFLML